MYYAHSGTLDDRSDWQLLVDHLLATANLAARYARPFGLEATAQLAGALHDLGKYDPAFDRRLCGENIRLDHSTAGAAILGGMSQGAERPAAEILGYAILGHHAGLPDKANTTEACMTRRIAGFQNRLDPLWRSEVQVDLAPLMPEIIEKTRRGPEAAFDLSLAVRMVFSCLVDADFRDTEAFYDRLEGREADRNWPALQDILPRLSAAFEAKIAGFCAATELNRLRADILAHVLGQASLRPGLFTLTVPTGGGKTLASMGFALGHARAHGHQRIIYAIPFTSVIDQTAGIFRGMFGEDAVLEHHSVIDEDNGRSDGLDRTGRDKLRLAMEDWAAPIVVTTNVQFFESLFAARTSRARKLHNIAGSVIILDEAQSVPRDLLLPCLRMLDALATHYGCTIVFCTATQPAFDSRHLQQGGLPLAGRELAPDPQGLARHLRRTRIERVGEMDDTALVAALGEVEQGLVIVNSRAHALALYRAAQAAELDGMIHLTTRQYAAHRQEVLADIRTRLKGEQPCRVIATSLVEAGVDLDFPRVWRAEAGLDSIVQAAGRCNREGRRPPEDSRVIIFAAPDNPAPAAVQALAKDMIGVAAQHDDLLAPDAIRDWFDRVYWRMGPERLDQKNILGKFTLSLSGTDFAFREVAALFRMIESPMVPVIVPRAPEAIRAVEKLGIEAISSGRLARALQRHTVQIPVKARDRLRACGHASFARPDLRGDQFCVLDTTSLYHTDSGLWWEDAEYLADEMRII
ncbi:CRISPR-associated endonuclease Cas3'' [Actibacterium sp. D379-3]